VNETKALTIDITAKHAEYLTEDAGWDGSTLTPIQMAQKHGVTWTKSRLSVPRDLDALMHLVDYLLARTGEFSAVLATPESVDRLRLTKAKTWQRLAVKITEATGIDLTNKTSAEDRVLALLDA
jgi:hypothetical protein